MNLRLPILGALIALVVCFSPTIAQETEEETPPPERKPSKYRITKVNLLPKALGPQAGVSQGRYIINFGSREGVQPGSIFRVMFRDRLMALVRIHHAWRDSAEARLVKLVEKADPDSPSPLEPGYYLEPKLVLLETIQFDKGDPIITPEMYKRLHYVARFIRSFPQFPLILEGHTDSSGKASSNIELAKKRAEGVRLFLNEVYRLPMTQMHAIGYGQERPIATNSTEEGRYRNRRVDIVLMDAQPN